MSKFTILTIARADLNMKGYILGLLNGFEGFLRKYPNVYLEIVTFGKDVSRIEQRIKSLDVKVSSHVTLYEKMQYEQLDIVWKDASVYVGMGTTILDAANKGVIPIPVAPYTEFFYSSGLFTDDPTRITADISQNTWGYDVVEKVYVMDSITYNETRRIANTCLNKYYDVFSTIHRIEEMSSGIKPIKRWNRIELYIEKMFLKIDDKRNVEKFKGLLKV